MITSNLLNIQPSGQHETPIKRGKQSLIDQPRTAESEQKELNTLESIEAQEFFEQFQKIVKITVQEDPQLDDDVQIQRKLNYEFPVSKAKLQFSPKYSSMKKRERVCFKSKTQQKLEGIVLFDVKESQKENKIFENQAQNQTTKNKEERFLTPVAVQKLPRELISWATRKKLAYSD